MGGVGANWKKGGDSLPRLATVITNNPRSDTVTATIRGCWVGVLELSPWPHPIVPTTNVSVRISGQRETKKDLPVICCYTSARRVHTVAWTCSFTLNVTTGSCATYMLCFPWRLRIRRARQHGKAKEGGRCCRLPRHGGFVLGFRSRWRVV